MKIIKNIFSPLGIAIAFAAVGSALGQTSGVRNTGDKPLGLVEVYMEGKAIAGLYVMPGETMRVRNQDPIAGAGYYEAKADNYFPVRCPDMKPIMFEGNVTFASLHVDKVEWDHNGQLTSITGLCPFLYNLDISSNAITSDVKKPKIANGNLYIKLEGHGDTEYWVKIQYGKIAAIGKHQDGNLSATADASPSDEPYRTLTADDGFYFNAYPDGDWDITELGTISAKVKRITLVNKSREEIDVALTQNAVTNGRLETKQFGILMIKYEAGYWTFYATEKQIKKMKESLASVPEKQK